MATDYSQKNWPKPNLNGLAEQKYSSLFSCELWRKEDFAPFLPDTQCSQQNPLNHRDRISTTVGHFTECLTPSDLNGLLSVGEKQLVSVRVLNWLHAGGQSQWRTAVSLRFHPVCLWCTLWTTVKNCSEKYIERTRLTLWSAEWGNVFVCQLNILNGTLQCRTPIPMAIFVRLSL